MKTMTITIVLELRLDAEQTANFVENAALDCVSMQEHAERAIDSFLGDSEDTVYVTSVTIKGAE